MEDDIRWMQRFNSYKNALSVLDKAVDTAKEMEAKKDVWTSS
jgi:hypothetical protein